MIMHVDTLSWTRLRSLTFLSFLSNLNYSVSPVQKQVATITAARRLENVDMKKGLGLVFLLHY